VKRNAFCADVRIINYLDAQDTSQKNVLVIIKINNVKKLLSFRTWSLMEI